MSSSDRCSSLPIKGVVTFFYYDDVRAASDFHEEIVGLKRVADYGWCVIHELLPRTYLGLIDATSGSQRPIAGSNKGAMISIETNQLEAWLERMKRLGAVTADTELTCGCAGRTREFKLSDPGGYTVEFFSWITPPP